MEVQQVLKNAAHPTFKLPYITGSNPGYYTTALEIGINQNNRYIRLPLTLRISVSERDIEVGGLWDTRARSSSTSSWCNVSWGLPASCRAITMALVLSARSIRWRHRSRAWLTSCRALDTPHGACQGETSSWGGGGHLKKYLGLFGLNQCVHRRMHELKTRLSVYSAFIFVFCIYFPPSTFKP